MSDFIPWLSDDHEIPLITLPAIDVQAVIKNDLLVERELPRIAINQDINTTTDDGFIVRKSNYLTWNIKLLSQAAKSLSIKFTDTYLPESAIMFFYNSTTKFLIGPIRPENFMNGTYKSDYMNGEYMNIIVFLPSTDDLDLLDIKVTSFDHGISEFNGMDETFDDDFGNSEPCNVNVACESGLRCEIESVCKIIGEFGDCTGALVNNDCCDLKPYVLTANHCLLNGPVGDFVFRFNYQSPSCNPDGETSPAQWTTYNGAEVVSSWDGNDFTLVKLNASLTSTHGLAGWDNSSYIGNNTSIVHHPSGDIKKITFDDDSAVIETDESLSFPPNLVAGRYFRIELSNGINGDLGITEPGSSGAPWFNDSNRIYAQQRGGQISTCSSTSNKWGGMFSTSWEGNGTPNTRLRDWLGASSNPSILDCMESPFVTGPDLLCTSPRTFTLVNNMPCVKNVNWTVQPSHLFNSPTSGSGNVVTLSSSNNAKGGATLRFFLKSDSCEDVIIEKEIWIGSPQIFTSYPDPKICIGEFEEMIIPESPGATSYHLQSLSFGLSVFTSAPVPNIPFTVVGTQLGFHNLLLTVTNECGSSTGIIYVEVVRCDDDHDGIKIRSSDSEKEVKGIELYPNPANNEINVVYNNLKSTVNSEIEILSLDGKVLLKNKLIGNLLKIDIDDLPQGIFLIKSKIEGKVFQKKFIKI